MKIKKAIASIILVSLIMQVIMTVIPEGALAVENTEEQNKEESQEVEIGREYEIKEEETWDVSKNQDGSVMAKWTLEDRTLVISGNGDMRDWKYNGKDIDWHDSKYTNIIEKVIIEEGVTGIGGRAFYECSSLTNIEIPEGVTSIGGSAFSGCSSLTNIEIPEGVTSIGGSTFSGCSSLTNIAIPESAIFIGKGAFEGCSNLKSINVAINNKKYISEDGILFNKEKTELICYPAEKKDLKYIIPEGVTSIGTRAFYGCSSLTNIAIPESVIFIGNGAFEGCSSLTNIKIPEGVTSIEVDAFYGCSSLTNIEIPERVTSIGDSAFSGCSSLTNIKIPEGVTSIGDSTFYGCSSLTNIKIPEGVTSIGVNAFSRCSSLTNIEIPENVTNIGSYAFSRCSSLTNIAIPEGVTYIGDDAIGTGIVIFTKANTEGHRYAEEDKVGYIIDEEPPKIEYTPQNQYQTKVNVKDKKSGVKEKTLKYRWTQSLKVPSKESFKESLENGQVITNSKEGGIWYLWVYAEDKLGNEVIKSNKGDINNDKKIDITDIMILKRHIISENKQSWKLKGEELQIADMNQNGNIDITDLIILKKEIVKQ